MNNVEKNARILLLSLSLEIKRLWEYKINLVFDLLLRFVDTAVFFTFWAVILGSTSNFQDWTFQGFLLIFAFESFFISLLLSFSFACLFVFKIIHNAELDSFLSKPASTWVLAASKNIGFSYSGIIIGVIALIVAGMQGVQFSILTLAIIFVMISLGAAIASLFALSIASLSFWFGRTESFENIFESFWSFSGKPTNIFPIPLQALIAFTFPFIFTQTIPAMAVLEKTSLQELLSALGLEIIIAVIWFFAFSILWKKGLKRYESGGG